MDRLTTHPAVAIAFMLTLGGCAALTDSSEIVEAEVAIFHHLQPKPGITTYAFEPLPGQDGDLEYAAYKDLVRAQLRRYRFQEVGSDAVPEIIVAFSYTIDGGEDGLECIPIDTRGVIPMPIRDRGLVATPIALAEPGLPGYTPVCDPADSVSALRTQYTRDLMLYMIDGTTLEQDRVELRYEGSAKSRGPSAQLARVMPGMIEALFRDFPGESGATRVERVEIRNGQSRPNEPDQSVDADGVEATPGSTTMPEAPLPLKPSSREP